LGLTTTEEEEKVLIFSHISPAGDPRGAAIGTYEAIRNVWSCHREIIHDFGPVPATWKTPQHPN
jgi:hypothetical protein